MTQKIHSLIKSKDFAVTFAFIFGAAITLLCAYFETFAEQCEKVPEEVFRLHILANSDSDEDQKLKYELRDYIISDLSDIFTASETLQEAEAAAAENMKKIELKAREFILSKGYDYPVHAETAKMYFSTRDYGNNITMPAGDYSALRLTIGNGTGKNWWCVLFPRLCVPAASADNEQEELTPEKEEEQSLYASSGNTIFTPETSKTIENGGKPKIRFWIYEKWKGIFG